jgi:SET domain-containing protein
MRLRRITARRSSVHGKGLFALQPIAAGERLIEYKCEVTSWRRAAARQRSEVVHTFLFGLSDGRVIDGSRVATVPAF